MILSLLFRMRMILIQKTFLFDMKPLKVNFNGKNLWWLKDEFANGALAPLEHCDELGNVIEPFGESFAHVYWEDGISRFGVKIGSIEDLKMGWI